MRATRPMTALAATALLGFLLAGCTAGDGADGGADANSSGSTETSGGGSLTWEDSPLQQYWGGSFQSGKSEQEEEEQVAASIAKQEEITAQCMKDEGFEYTPLQQASIVNLAAGDDVEWSPDEREWVEKYGYGIVSNPWGEQAASDGGTEVEDPNQTYIGTLSAAETKAYHAALYGEMSEVTTSADGEEAVASEYDWKTAGCSGKASHESMSATDDVYQQFSELTNNMSNLYTEVEGSDGALELDKQWSACMESAGFSFTRKIDAEEAIGKELATLGGVPDGVNDGDLTEKDKAKAAELSKKEIKTALADLDCREELDYSDQMLKLQFAAEEKFIADNKAELEQFKAAIEQAEKD